MFVLSKALFLDQNFTSIPFLRSLEEIKKIKKHGRVHPPSLTKVRGIACEKIRWLNQAKFRLTRHCLGEGGTIHPHRMFSSIKQERNEIETSGFQYLEVEAFATYDQTMEVKVSIGQE